MKKIAIVGGSPTSESLVPYEDKELEIWVLGNMLDRHIDKRVTRAFEIHDDIGTREGSDIYIKWLVSRNVPLVVGENFPASGSHVSVYPYKEIEDMYGSLYLTSSAAHMMALAILEGATHIGIYGIDMSVSDNEYFYQRPCMESWIGYARGIGIDVYIPKESHIGSSAFVYGAELKPKTPPFTYNEFSLMAQQHNAKVEELKNKVEELNNSIHAHSGAAQAYERMMKVARAIDSGNKVNTLLETTTMR